MHHQYPILSSSPYSLVVDAARAPTSPCRNHFQVLGILSIALPIAMHGLPWYICLPTCCCVFVSKRPVVNLYSDVLWYICLQTYCGVCVSESPVLMYSIFVMSPNVMRDNIPCEIWWYMCLQTSCGVFVFQRPVVYLTPGALW